ncbi:MAG: alcohol dehydrogenase catalytic domain-containing protein, partial [Fidelibacterota bacterium]
MMLHKTAPIQESPLAESESPVPEPGAGEIRVKVKVCGVCRTDLHIIEGDLDIPNLPIVPGHQIVGIVDALGEDVSKVNVGDRVGLPWMNSTCGKCPYCVSGRENLCNNARFTGLHRNGGYCEFMVAPDQFVYSIPERFPDNQAAPLLCAGIIGYRTLKQSHIR